MSSKMKYTKGERLNIHSNSKIRLEFHGARLTSDGGLLAYRELDEALGLFESASAVMNDRRTGRNIQHNITNLLRQSVYSRLAGYEDVNDAQRLSADPVMRAITGKKKNAASINTIGRFETKVLTLKENLASLSKINGSWIQKAMEKTPHHRVILYMDSSESPVHGEQEDSAYNGHFGCNCYHPLFCFHQYGDCEGAMLRSGNVHSADRWKDLLEPIIRRYEENRRPHPLRKASLTESIDTERVLLAELKDLADVVIDTTDLNVHQLRGRITDQFSEGSPHRDMRVSVTSFGFKHGIPRGSDLMFDVRFLPNPHWVPELRPYRGTDGPVASYVMSDPDATEFLDKVESLLSFLIPRFEAEGKSYLAIAIGCTGGHHRSVALAEKLGEWLTAEGIDATVRHRDIER